MLDVEKITGAPRADIITGELLAPFTSEMFGMVSGYFRRRVITEYAGIAAELRKEKPSRENEAQAVLEVLDMKTRNGDYNWSRPGFIAEAFDIANLPFLLWLSLRVKKPKISLAEATAMITQDNAKQVQTGILQLMRYLKDESELEAERQAELAKKKAESEAAGSEEKTTGSTDQSSSPDSSS
jgi:hypothetical protein